MRSVVDKIIQKVSRRREMGRNRKFLQDFLAEVKTETWKKGRLIIPNFIIFTAKKSKARSIHNPQTNEQMHLPAVKVIKARVAKDWRTK